MAKSSFKHYTIGLLALGTALLTGCMSNGNETQDSSEYGKVSVTMATGDMTGSQSTSGLNKGSVITLKKLIVTFVSNASTPDTVTDTITTSTTPSISATSTANQTVTKSYVLKALRTWYITTKTLDIQDSVVHTKQDTVLKLLAGENRAKSIALNPRFVMYKANFSFPDSLSTSQTTIKQKITVKRLVMKVDGLTVVDSTGTFAASTPYSIGYDYVPVNTGTTVELSVYGSLSGFVSDSLLYSKTDISISGLAPTIDGSHTTTLPYVGPVTGAADLEVTINKVGLYTMTVNTDSEVIPKSGAK